MCLFEGYCIVMISEPQAELPEHAIQISKLSWISFRCAVDPQRLGKNCNVQIVCKTSIEILGESIGYIVNDTLFLSLPPPPPKCATECLRVISNMLDVAARGCVMGFHSLV